MIYSILNSIDLYFSNLKLKICKKIANILLSRPDRYIELTDLDDSYSRRKEAIHKLIDVVPSYFSEDLGTYVENGIFSWQRKYSDGYEVIPLDLVFPNIPLIFVLNKDTRRVYNAESNSSQRQNILTAPDSYTKEVASDKTSSEFLGSSSQARLHATESVEAIFRKQILESDDPIPIVPVFCTPEDILNARNKDELRNVLNNSWHESLNWALRILPSIDDNSKEELSPWELRRLWIEEVQKFSLFPIK